MTASVFQRAEAQGKQTILPCRTYSADRTDVTHPIDEEPSEPATVFLKKLNNVAASTLKKPHFLMNTFFCTNPFYPLQIIHVRQFPVIVHTLTDIV